MSTTTEAVKDLRTSLEELRGDVPRLEELLERRDSEYLQAKAATKGIEQLADLRARRDAVESMLEQHREEIEETARDLARLESAVEDEGLLAEIAAGTVEYREAEAQWYAVMDGAERAVRRAATLARHLNRAANHAFGRATSAAVQLRQKHGGPESFLDEQLRRAVVGADVEPLARGGFNVPVWASHDFGGRFKGLARIRDLSGAYADIDPEEELP